jgi:hypothetical protein
VPDAALSTGDPAYLDLAHLLVGLSSAAQNFDGNGYALRYYTGFNDELLTSSLGAPSDLIGLGDAAPIGSRPSVPNRPPPLRPDVPCTAAGGPVDLSANTAPSDFERSGARLHVQLPADLPTRDWKALTRRLERALKETGR